jgi:hypothetical protein
MTTIENNTSKKSKVEKIKKTLAKALTIHEIEANIQVSI